MTAGTAKLCRASQRQVAELVSCGAFDKSARVCSASLHPSQVHQLLFTLQPPKGLFERDLGEGRKLKVDPSDMKNNASRTTQGKKGGPSASADARAEPDVKVSGGGLPGISKKLPDSPTSAPIS